MIKRVFLVVCLTALFFYCHGQMLNNGVDLSTRPEIKYIDTWYTKSGIMKKTLHCTVQYGEKKPAAVCDNEGKEIVFENLISIFNHLAGFGWEYVETYTEVDGGFKLEHYIFKRNN